MAYQRRKPTTIGAKAHYPGCIEPALATAIEKVPSGDRWIHEIKFDGYRVQLHIANEAITIFTRRGHDWTKRFKKIAGDAYLINASSAIIDGEVVMPAANGTTDFSDLQNELKGKSYKIVMVGFDLLYLNGYDLRKLPMFERKALLKPLAAKTHIQFSDSFEIEGRDMFQHACRIGLEGVVSKVRDSRYQSGRGNYVGRYKGKDLVYAGKVDHGFDGDFAKELQARLKPLIRGTQPYAKKIAHRATWVEPQLLAEIEYRVKSAEGKLRHPFFKGIREDLG
jgi:bifunctional non-homologous end joining protein LigD